MSMRNFFVSVCLATLVTGCGDDSPTKAPVGAACEENKDCELNDCRQSLVSVNPFGGPSFEYPLPGGLCTSECMWAQGEEEPVQTTGTCDEGQWCLRYVVGDQVCFQGCEDECEREDHVCTVISAEYGISACLPPEDSERVIEDPGYLITSEQYDEFVR